MIKIYSKLVLIKIKEFKFVVLTNQGRDPSCFLFLVLLNRNQDIRQSLTHLPYFSQQGHTLASFSFCVNHPS